MSACAVLPLAKARPHASSEAPPSDDRAMKRKASLRLSEQLVLDMAADPMGIGIHSNMRRRCAIQPSGGTGRPRPCTRSPARPRAADRGVDPVHLGALLPPVVGPVAAALAESGTEAAVAAYGRLASAQPATVDLDDERFVNGVWGAIELHRTDLVWPLLRLPVGSPARLVAAR